MMKDNHAEVCQTVEKMLASLKFGTITLVVQDGKVIQIEKSEKVRIR
ncbi:YezD family protein [Massilibacterium senegalense]|nr:YezD family protein [Massilibacterium senegalense]